LTDDNHSENANIFVLFVAVDQINTC